MRQVGRSADVVIQPGAQLGERTYCPVSGVVFTVKDTSPKVMVDDKPIYFCCAGCAAYFEANKDRIVALRALLESKRQ